MSFFKLITIYLLSYGTFALCADPMTQSVIFVSKMEDTRKMIQSPNVKPGEYAELLTQQRQLIGAYMNYRKLRPSFMKVLDPVLNEIKSDSKIQLKKLVGKDLESTDGTRDEKRLTYAKQYYLDLQQAFRLQVLLSSIEYIDQKPNKITVKRVIDKDGTVSYKTISLK